MALCESQLDSALPQLKREESSPQQSSGDEKSSPVKKAKIETNGDIYVPEGLPLSVDYRSPVSHFMPPAVELYAARHKPETNNMPGTSLMTPVKRKRGRPRIDKTSPEYLANLAARKQAKEMAAVMNNRTPPSGGDSGEKRKRGRPRVDKTSPEYLARKRAREIEALEKKAKKECKRRGAAVKSSVKTSLKANLRAKKLQSGKKPLATTSLRKLKGRGEVARNTQDKKAIVRRNTKFIRRKDSAASSSAGESTPRVKRKYTKRTPSTKKNDSNTSTERVKGKRGRPRKVDPNNPRPQQPKIRVRNNLMPMNSEPISLDSDDEPDLGSPSQASDSLSLDENLRAIRHIHEKYANIDKDDMYQAHLLAANFKKPPKDVNRLRDEDDVVSIRSSEGGASIKEDARVEKLDDSSNSDSDSSSSGSSSSGSSSSSTSGSSSSSDSSDSESDEDKKNSNEASGVKMNNDNNLPFGVWPTNSTQSDSDSDPERSADFVVPAGTDDVSESENESCDKSFQCHICRKWYSTKVTLKIHRRSHQNRGSGTTRSRAKSSDRYECDCCNETFSRREKLWEHKAVAHRGAMTVRCEVCRKCFEDDNELAAHTDTHTEDDRAGRCSQCGACFARYEQLRRHWAAVHGGEAGAGEAAGGHACGVCGKRFTHAHSLTRHLHNHAKQLYRCVVCKASFARADQLAQHLNSHLATYKRMKP